MVPICLNISELELRVWKTFQKQFKFNWVSMQFIDTKINLILMCSSRLVLCHFIFAYAPLSTFRILDSLNLNLSRMLNRIFPLFSSSNPRRRTTAAPKTAERDSRVFGVLARWIPWIHNGARLEIALTMCIGHVGRSTWVHLSGISRTPSSSLQRAGHHDPPFGVSVRCRGCPRRSHAGTAATAAATAAGPPADSGHQHDIEDERDPAAVDHRYVGTLFPQIFSFPRERT